MIIDLLPAYTPIVEVGSTYLGFGANVWFNYYLNCEDKTRNYIKMCINKKTGQLDHFIYVDDEKKQYKVEHRMINGKLKRVFYEENKELIGDKLEIKEQKLAIEQKVNNLKDKIINAMYHNHLMKWRVDNNIFRKQYKYDEEKEYYKSSIHNGKTKDIYNICQLPALQSRFALLTNVLNKNIDWEMNFKQSVLTDYIWHTHVDNKQEITNMVVGLLEKMKNRNIDKLSSKLALRDDKNDKNCIIPLVGHNIGISIINGGGSDDNKNNKKTIIKIIDTGTNTYGKSIYNILKEQEIKNKLEKTIGCKVEIKEESYLGETYTYEQKGLTCVMASHTTLNLEKNLAM